MKFLSAYDREVKRWHHFSPTLLQAYEDCHRIPYYDKILGLSKPKFKAQVLGDKMHAQLEHLVLTGQDCLEPRLKLLRQYLPEQLPHKHVLPEIGLDGKTKFIRGDHPFDYESSVLCLEGIPLEGYLDLFDQRSPDYPIVTDYKTTKNISQWAKSPEEVGNSLQMLLYAKAATFWVPEAPEVRVRHLYAQTEGEIRGEPRATVLTRTQIDMGWERANVLAQGLKYLEGQISDETIEPTGIAHGMCTKYHGCPFMQTCLKTPQAMLKQRLKLAVERNESQEKASTQTREETHMNLIERIKQKQVEAATPVPDMDAKEARKLVEQTALAPNPLSAEAREFVELPKKSLIIDESTTPDVPRGFVGIIPPDAPPNNKDAVPEPKKRGRPKKEVLEAKLEDKPEAKPEAKLEAKPEATKKLPIRLYINALPPAWENFRDLSEYAADKASEIAKALQVQDYRLTDLGAVKGVGGLSALIRQEPPIAGTYIAFTTGFGTPVQVAVDTLLPLVEWYTRGVR